MKSLVSTSSLDVYVEDVKLYDHPARLVITVSVGPLHFFSEITYDSIPSWSALWEEYGYSLRSRLLGLVVSWDCMRFLALGGERLVLCDGLEVSLKTQKFWTEAFRKQFSEWRYLNKMDYPSADYPKLLADISLNTQVLPMKSEFQPCELLANGGGKDSLAGMLLLSNAGAYFDLYEACLPVGGSLTHQNMLLSRLSDDFLPRISKCIRLKIRDDFFSVPEDVLRQANVHARFYKTDFAVGHTANYAGFFPLILFHKYQRVWLNIEKSAEETSLFWKGESISHQWCKSEEYRHNMKIIFSELVGDQRFRGFYSTVGALRDISIYKIVSQYPELLAKTHSCNYGKPWCNQCVKCCFCYLMMSAFLGEEYAMEVTGSRKSLFAQKENTKNWESLLNKSEIAWECVPAYSECWIAAYLCIQQGIHYPVLERYCPSKEAFSKLWQACTRIDWDDVPLFIRESTKKLLYD